MAKRRSAGSGRNRATVRVFSPTTQPGASGTRQPHAGQTVSAQYRKASARQPFASCSIPHAVTWRSTASNTSCCAARTCPATSAPPPTMRSAPQVRSAATGLRSEPYASQPRRAASNGTLPPPQNASPTRGARPKRRRPSSRTSSGRLAAAVPRCALIAGQASADGPSTCSGRSHQTSFSS